LELKKKKTTKLFQVQVFSMFLFCKGKAKIIKGKIKANKKIYAVIQVYFSRIN